MDAGRRRVLLAATTAALAPAAVRAADAPAPDALRADAELLRRAYTALHPGLYRYRDATQVARLFDTLGDRLAAADSPGAMYLALSDATAAIRCGHSYPNPYNQRRALRATHFAQRDRLPFLFAWRQGAMVVLDGLSDARLPRGARVAAIGDVPADAMLRRLVVASRADGSNDAKRVRNLDVRGVDRWEAFDLLMPMAFPTLVAGGRVTLSVRRPGADAVQRVDVELVTADERAGRIGPKPAMAWRWERPDRRTAILTMPTWALYGARWDWRRWLDARLDALVADRARTLVVDLRGNEGGQDCGDALIERLLRSPIDASPAARRVRYRRVPAALDRFLDTWDDSFRDWGDDAIGPDADGSYRLMRFDDPGGGAVLRPRDARFAGRVLVLVDASNSSATFQFAERVKANGLATLVGETTGGNRRGINGGAFFFLRLPASGIEVDVPLVGTFPAGTPPDAGVEPDVRVTATADDVARGADPAMTTALALARG